MTTWKRKVEIDFARSKQLRDDLNIDWFHMNSILTSANGNWNSVCWILTIENIGIESELLILLDFRDSINDQNNNNIVKCACVYGYLKLLKELVERCHIYMFRHDHLHFACKYQQKDVVKYLLYNAKIDYEWSKTALFETCENENTEILKLLLGCSYNGIESIDDYGDALRLACQKGNVDIVNLLLNDSRIDPSYLDCYVLDYTTDLEINEDNKYAIVALLLRHPKIRENLSTSDLTRYEFMLGG